MNCVGLIDGFVEMDSSGILYKVSILLLLTPKTINSSFIQCNISISNTSVFRHLLNFQKKV